MKKEVRSALIRTSTSFFFLFAFFFSPVAFAIDASNQYRSPRNPERAIRRSTELIVLHTTEAPAKSSLNKVSERGECHFCVTEDGSVYRIVDRDREAFHAGRSMWNGKEDVDKFSVGIECVGYHDKAMPLAQLKAIAQLVKELKGMYHLSDEQVVAHSHVAYGAPNRWQKKRHRGRKRCGMLFATDTIRRILELKAKPVRDADVCAKRLMVADAHLNRVLYGGADIMARYYPSVKTAPPKQIVRHPMTNPQVPTASVTTRDLVRSGYKIVGTISETQSAIKIVGKRWNDKNTFYSIRDKIFSGRQINPSKLEKGTSVWIKP